MPSIPMQPSAPLPGGLRPNVADVSQHLRTRTVGGQMQGGLGSDTGPSQLTTFDDNSRPTAAEVERFITTSLGAILGRVNGGVTWLHAADLALTTVGEEALYVRLFRSTVALHAAVPISMSFFRESIDREELDLMRDLVNENVAALNNGLATYRAGLRLPTFGSLPMRTGYDEDLDAEQV